MYPRIPDAIKQFSNRLTAAEKIVKAKGLEHEAALILGVGVEEARNAVMAAEEAYLDAKTNLFRALKQLG